MNILTHSLAGICVILLVSQGYVIGQDQPPVPSPMETATQANGIERKSRYVPLSTDAAQTALQLSDEQKQQVSQLLQTLTESLAATEPTQQPGLISRTDEQIETILNASQLAAFDRLFPRKKLKFAFRFQKWDSVLQWIADEANLSLVMDAPPPGSFNYTDSKEYSPTAAIDLLNGWLLTKGFTLVQRDRLLMVLDMTAGIPSGAIPQIPVEQLPLRGDFEFVTVLFPLEGRTPDSVSTEIKPFVSTHGSSELLSQTGQILVTDTAGNLRKIQTLIQSIPLPTKPTPPTPKPVPKPVLKTYAIQHANPDQVGEVVKQFVGGTVFVDAAAGQISINAIDADQARAQQIIDQLEANQGTGQKQVVELYSINNVTESDIVATLQLVAPNGAYRIDEPSRKLLAWASPADQIKISEVLKKLESEDGGRVPPQLEVYAIDGLDADSLQTVLSSLLPDARSSLDGRSSSLVVIGTMAEHMAVKSLIEQLRSKEPTLKRSIETYTITPSSSSALTGVLTQLVPQAQFIPGTDSENLVVLASESDHAVIKNSLDALLAQLSPVAESTLQAYPVTNSDSALLTDFIAKTTPNAQVTVDSDRNRLLIMAQPDEHEQIAKILELIQPDGDSGNPVLKSYRYQNAETSSAAGLFTSLVPKAVVTSDVENQRFFVVATDAEQAEVAAILAELERDAGDDQRVLTTYKVPKGMAIDSLSSLVSSLAPEAQINGDSAIGQLVIVAKAADHALIQDAIQQLAPENAGRLLELRFYMASIEKLTETVTLLTSLVPDAQISSDAATGRLNAVASAEDHQAIADTLQKLAEVQGAAEPAKLVIYQVTTSQKKRFQELAASLTATLPGLQVLGDAEPKELAVWARPTQHAAVTEILDQLSQELPAEKKPYLVSYPVEKLEANTIHESLSQFFPDLEIRVDSRANRLLIWAAPKEHEMLKSTIEQLDTDLPDAVEIKLMAYPIRGVDSSVAVQLLQQELPDLFVVEDTTAQTLVVRGKLRDHERVAAILDTLRSSAQTQTARQVVVYPFEGADPTAVRELLLEAYPDARIVADPVQQRLLVWASPADHEQIGGAVSEMQGSLNAKPTLKTYTVKPSVDPSFLSVIERAAPQAVLTWNTDQNRLIVWASEQDQETIGKVIDGVTADDESVPAKELRVFDIAPAGAAMSLKVLAAAVPDVEFMESGDGKRAIAWVDEATAKQIQSTLDELASEASLNMDRELRIFPLQGLEPSLVTSVLATAVPGTTFSTLADGESIAAWTLSVDEPKIQQVLTQLQEADATRSERSVMTYSIRDLGPNVTTVLGTKVPDASIVAGADANQIVVTATAQDHQQIKELLELFVEAKPQPEVKDLTIYDIRGTTPAAVLELMQPLVNEDIQFTVDEAGNRLFVRSRPDQQPFVKKMIEQVTNALPDRSDLVTKVYPFEQPDADEVQSALVKLLPAAEFVVDSEERLLVATATKQEHETVQQIVAEVISNTTQADTPVAKVYSLDRDSADQVLSTLQNVFAARDASLTVDRENGVLLAVASEKVHLQIGEFLKQLSDLPKNDNERSLKFYAMEERDLESTREVVQDLLEQADVDATVIADSTGNQLVISTTAEAHRSVQSTIDQMGKRAPLKVEVFQLSYADATSAELAIFSLFEDQPNESAPIVQGDVETQQLFVRGTEEQIEEIRALLIKMGERDLDDSIGRVQRGNLRQILMQDDPDRVLQQMQRLWPQLRGNPIQILQPQGKLKKLGPTEPFDERPDTPNDDPPARGPSEKGPSEKGPAGAQFSIDDDPRQQQAAPDQAPKSDAATPLSERSPIVVIPGDRRLTIASEDTEALDEFEKLLRTLQARTRPSASRDFTVYALQNAPATDLADTLQRLFNDRRGARLATGEVLIVADQRLNALVVHANRTDRAKLESLIQTLDSSNAPDTLTAYQTEVIRLVHANASEISDILSGIYRAQMTAGGARRSVSIPEGIPAELSSVLRQINAAASSPLLTIQVDAKTNALVVKAPKNLLTEVTELAKQLDDSVATSPARRLKVIPLEKVNSRRMLQLLNEVLE